MHARFERMDEHFGTAQRAGEMLEFVSTGAWKGGHTWKRLAHGRIGGLCNDYISCGNWCCWPYCHDTSIFQTASGSVLGSGFGYALRLRHQAFVCLWRLTLDSGIRFGFGRLLCTFGKALPMPECAIVLGTYSFRESREKSGSTGRSVGKVGKSLFFF